MKAAILIDGGTLLKRPPSVRKDVNSRAVKERADAKVADMPDLFADFNGLPLESVFRRAPRTRYHRQPLFARQTDRP